jgi:putative membrane protein insertion efficiency factor
VREGVKERMITRLVLTAIKLFQKTRVLRQPACRFYPSCSDYALGCIERHGLAKGMLLTLWRILRCQPLHPGGLDPVPDIKHKATSEKKTEGRAYDRDGSHTNVMSGTFWPSASNQSCQRQRTESC